MPVKRYTLHDLQDAQWWRTHEAALNRDANRMREEYLKSGKAPRLSREQEQSQRRIRQTHTIDTARLENKYERAAAIAILGDGNAQEQSKAFRALQSNIARDIKTAERHLKETQTGEEHDNLKRHLGDLKQLQSEMRRTYKMEGGETRQNPFNTRINAAITYATEYRGAGMELLHKTQGFTSSRVTSTAGQDEIYDRFYNYYLGDRRGSIYEDLSSERLDDLYRQLDDAARRYDSDEFGRVARLVEVEQDRLLTERYSYHAGKE